MGWMGSSQTTQSSVSPEQRAAQGTAMNFGLYAAQQPFRQYDQPWTAAWRPELQQAGGMFMNAPGVGADNINGGASMIRSAGSFQPQVVRAGQTTAGQTYSQNTTARNSTADMGSEFMGQYFNPFLSQVGGQMVDDMGRARNIQIQGDEDKALAAGAYGGSRHGVADAETTRGYYDRLGSSLTGLYADGFRTAAGLGQQDAQRFTDVDRANADRTLQSDTGNATRALTSDMGNADRRLNSDQGNANRTLNADQFNSTQGLNAAQLRLNAGTSLAGVGDMQHDNYLGDASGLFGFGQAVQGYDQAAVDRDRERFNEWRDYPQKQSEIINHAAGLVQGGGTSTVSSQQSPVSGAMSGAMTGAMLGSVVPGIGTAVGAIGGGLLGAFSSDRNIKSDVRRLGSDDQVLRGIKKTPVSTWRYDPAKGGPDDGGRPHIGPMAQDVKRNLGIGDGHSMPAVDVMGAHHAAIRSLAKKVDDITDVKIKRKIKAKGKSNVR